MQIYKPLLQWKDQYTYIMKIKKTPNKNLKILQIKIWKFLQIKT